MYARHEYTMYTCLYILLQTCNTRLSGRCKGFTQTVHGTLYLLVRFFSLSFSLFRIIIIIIIPTKPITIIFIAKRTTYTKIVVVVNLRSLRRLCSAEREKRGITIIYFNARCTCNIVFRGETKKKKRLNTISTFYIVRLNIKL